MILLLLANKKKSGVHHATFSGLIINLIVSKRTEQFVKQNKQNINLLLDDNLNLEVGYTTKYAGSATGAEIRKLLPK